MFGFLTIVSGLAWTIVYIEAIRIGVKQHTYAMPIAALGLNFAWESIYAVNALSQGVSAQGIINLVWACADFFIVCTFFRFGRSELPRFVTRGMFIAWGVAIIGISYLVQALFLVEFGMPGAPRYSAFLQNALMSGLFISFFIGRRGSHGQSLTLAVAKWIGTLAPTIGFGVVQGFNPFIFWLGVICSVLDLAYIGLLIWNRRNPTALQDPAVEGQAASGDALPVAQA